VIFKERKVVDPWKGRKGKGKGKESAFVVCVGVVSRWLGTGK